MNYDGTTLKVILVDTNSSASNTQNYPIKIPAEVGGSTAFVGFTGATGALTATQDILNWTFGKVGTATRVQSSPNPSVTGQAVTFTATVSPTGSTAATLTGKVDFKEGGTDLTPGGVPINGAGQATFTTTSLAVGTHTITGIYSGDGNFQTSTGDDSAAPQVVNKASTTTGVASTPNPSVSGEAVTFTATVAAMPPGSGTPTGSVDFKEGGTDLTPGGVSLNGAGQATFSTSSLTVASHTITATYGGDMSFLTSTGDDSALPQVVNKASTTTAVTSAPNPSTFGTTVTFTATVAPVPPGAGTPTGTVDFSEGNTTLASSVALTSGMATFTISTLAKGTHTITASYGGDMFFEPSMGDDSGTPQVVT
jgi:hypothetical protein